jgi:hypothetical protein
MSAELLPHVTHTNNNAIATAAPDLRQFDSYYVVPTFPLDLIRSALRPVHLVKMDIEGMEYRASIGALTMFREQRPLVFSEYSPAYQRSQSGVDGAELLKLFFQLGYGVEILHRGQDREEVQAATEGDAIARIDAAWRQHVDEDSGTHLDLCLKPAPKRPGV